MSRYVPTLFIALIIFMGMVVPVTAAEEYTVIMKCGGDEK
jgi:hypothetical protein